MTLLDRLALLSPIDAIALGALVTGWLIIGWWIERENTTYPSVTVLMIQYRRDWMQEMVRRDPRIFDAQMLSSLRQGTAFFSSTCVIALGGVLALIGNAERLVGVAEDLALSGVPTIPTIVWQVKLGLVALLLTHAFLKFVWSNRLFGYCAVVMGAVPNDPDHPLARHRAWQSGELNIRAAWNFNRGLRAMYFALAALAWLLGALTLLGAVVVTIWVLWSREFMSRPREVLLTQPPAKP
ncbi:DUF599 domain-containing protein [Oceaniovalibus sp. ACAM 378]|jgi:uncharacterized membrane protein|uniref:DUF599 domain-containing protein n=1 Tax=Oceaniovalibus sp. ACAM 378 TaxID=2599923 RepID=UPI0011D8A8A2|nr:DUF599 domain-containing protein [Oceaniovalibus sp. ACAM 378]TYB90746.1 DUF599 domain-containing protein [Oceaniovalibus sp. ACAM 378]